MKDTGKTVVIGSFRLSAALWAWIRRLAKHEHRTSANMMRVLLEEAKEGRNGGKQ